MGNTLCFPCASSPPLLSVVESFAFMPPDTNNSDGENEDLTVPDYGVVTMRHFRSDTSTPDRVRKHISPQTVVATDKDNNTDVYVIVYSHGNACTVDSVSPNARAMSRVLDIDVVLYDYPGYGGNTERPSERGAFAAAHAAFAYAERIAGSPERVFVFGHSLGTGPSMELATQHPCAGLILQAPIRSAIRVALPTLMFTPWMDIMTNEDKVDLLDEKLHLFVLHGKKDAVVKVAHGKVIADRARMRLDKVTSWWPSTMGHDNMHSHRDYYRHLQDFIDKVKESQ